MKSAFLFILILVIQTWMLKPVNAQKGHPGVFEGSNINFLSAKSSLNLDDETGSKPSLSYNVGGFYKLSRGKLNFIGMAEYSRIKNRLEPDIALYDANEYYIGKLKHWTVNHNLAVSVIGTFKIKKGFYMGTGISNNILLKSTSITEENHFSFEGQKLGNRFNNSYYRRMVISIPVLAGYEFNRFDLFLRFNKGIMNRIKGDNNIHEIDNTLMLGLSYTFIPWK